MRSHWLLSGLLLAGLVLRVLALIAYRPALLYIDSLKYLYGAWPGNDPLGYNVILKGLLAPGNLEVVAAVQHLLGLAMAVTLYLLLFRRGVPRWLAALATAPVLLDAYQLQIEQTIMPDVWFEAFIVAGLACLLWRPRPGMKLTVAAGLVLGCAAPVAQVGEILILPALAYLLLVASGSWRHRLLQAAALCAAFAVPIIGFSAQQYVVAGQFSLASAAGNTIYGRLAEEADCATLKIPSYERALCPSRELAAELGPDGLVHNAESPDHLYVPPPGISHGQALSNFDRSVLTQQAPRVAWGVLADATKLFAVHRVTSAGDTPIARWQFQTWFPTFGQSITVSRDHIIVLGLQFASSGGPIIDRPLAPSLGGKAIVVRPVARFLRGYQLGGGYTPGPLLALAALAGLLGVLPLARRRRLTPGQLQLAQACLLVFGAGALVLLASNAFEFSWRYQLPALVTLPPAGALGIALGIDLIRGRRRRDQPGPAAAGPAAAGPAEEQSPGQPGAEVAGGRTSAPSPAVSGTAVSGTAEPGSQPDTSTA